MAAQIPVKNNDELNNKNLKKVYEDKKKKQNGMDGTWVAHPGLINTARNSFMENKVVKHLNQISYIPDVDITS